MKERKKKTTTFTFSFNTNYTTFLLASDVIKKFFKVIKSEQVIKRRST